MSIGNSPAGLNSLNQVKPGRTKLSFSLLFFALLFSACLNDSQGGASKQNPEPDIPSSTFTEFWEEAANPNLIRFAGTDLEMQLGRDSIAIVISEFTDAITCTDDASGKQVCSPLSWEHHYLGTYTRQDSTLSMRIRFDHSFPNVPAPAIMADSTASFRMRYSPDSSRMTLVLLSGTDFLQHGFQWNFQKLDHRKVSVVSPTITNDCGPADQLQTRMTFEVAPCSGCDTANRAPYSFYLQYQDVDDIKPGETRYASAWRCGNLGCTDSTLATIDISSVSRDSVGGRISLRKGMTRSMGVFSAPKKHERPPCG
jgi:hypothetical protein